MSDGENFSRGPSFVFKNYESVSYTISTGGGGSGRGNIEVTYDALRKRIAELEAALRKVAEWERLLGLADSWITAAIECKEWRWDADQHEAATLTRDEIRAALEGKKS